MIDEKMMSEEDIDDNEDQDGLGDLLKELNPTKNNIGEKKKKNLHGVTPRQELFAQTLVYLTNFDAVEAVKQSYRQEGDYSQTNAYLKAQALMCNPNVRRRISDISKERDEHVVVDRLWIKEKLKKIAETGETENARIKALELLGKNLSMWVDKQIIEDITETPKDMILKGIEARMAKDAEKKEAEKDNATKGDNVVQFPKTAEE